MDFVREIMGASCRSGNSLEENVAVFTDVVADAAAASGCGCDVNRGCSNNWDWAAKDRIIPLWEGWKSDGLPVELTRRDAALDTVDRVFSIIMILIVMVDSILFLLLR